MRFSIFDIFDFDFRDFRFSRFSFFDFRNIFSSIFEISDFRFARGPFSFGIPTIRPHIVERSQDVAGKEWGRKGEGGAPLRRWSHAGLEKKGREPPKGGQLKGAAASSLPPEQ